MIKVGNVSFWRTDEKFSRMEYDKKKKKKDAVKKKIHNEQSRNSGTIIKM